MRVTGATEGARRGLAGVAAPAARERAVAYALLLFAVVAWGGSFVAARALLAPAAPGAAALTPAMLAALRFGLAAALFVPLLLARRFRPGRGGGTTGYGKPGGLGRRDLLRLAGLGQLGITVYFWLQYTGVRLTNAGVASILVVGLIPIATAIVARLRLREALGRAHAVALALGLAGVVIVTAGRGAGLALGISRDFGLGALCLVSNAVCFALYSTFVRDFRARYDSLTLTAGTTVAGALGLLGLAALGGGWGAIGRLSAAQWLAVGYLALVCSVLAYFGYNRALATLEAGRAAAWVYLEPPVALLLGALLLSETVTAASLLGGALIAASVWVISRAR